MKTQNNISIDGCFLEFAKEISKGFPKLQFGQYKSNCGKYVVSIVDCFGKNNLSPMRVSNISEEIQLSKNILVNQYFEEYIYFLLIWGYYKRHAGEINEEHIDVLSINFFRENNIYLGNIARAFVSVLENAPTELNKRRICEYLRAISE